MALCYNYSMRTGGEVVILGGGVIGLTAAYFLAREGVRVRLLDKGQIGREASWAGAGILPPSDWLSARQPIDRLRALSGRLFAELSAELRERSGIDNGYVPCGGLEVLVEQDDIGDDEWSGEGTPREVLDETEVATLEPAIAGGLGRALHLPTLAQLRNPRHLQALRAACGQTGKVTFTENDEATGLTVHEGKIRSVITPAGAVEGDAFLISMGAWSDRLLESLNINIGIRPVRGQIALLNPGQMLFRRVLIWGSRYLVPRRDGRVLIGSTEEDAGFNKHTTTDGIAGLLQLAVKLVPALGRADVEQCWAGLRPGSPDGLPFIGRAPGIDNLFVAAGHFRAGIQLSPGTGMLLKEMILGQPLTMPVEAFRLERMACD
jgi:glycine oxidase